MSTTVISAPRYGTRILSPSFVLTALVGATFAARLVTVFVHETPRYFPDEYIYSALARSLSHGSLTIRGEPASFPALLEPLLTAPAWLAADTEVAYRLALGLHALLASLVALPAYLVARRLGLTARQALACAALSVTAPGFVYVSYLTADVLGLVLAIAAVVAAIVALERPTSRNQAAFLGLAGLATFARLQYIVVPLAFAAAAIVVSRGNPRRVLGEFRFTVIAIVLVASAAVVSGPARILGYYDNVLHLDLEPSAIALWTGTDLLLLAYAAGLALVPFALVGLSCGIVRPRSRRELGFSVLATALIAGLLGEAAVFAANGSERFQERYLLLVSALVPPLAFLGFGRLRQPWVRPAIAVIVVGLFTAVLAVPLSGFTVGTSKQDSPFLQAVTRLEEIVGVGEAATAVAFGGGIVCALVALTALRRRGTGIVIAVALVLSSTVAALATWQDLERSALARSVYLGSTRDWVDRAGLGETGVLLTSMTDRAAVAEQLFWNQDLTTLLRLPGADEVDAFGSSVTRVSGSGVIMAGGRPWDHPLLVQEHSARATLDDAEFVSREANTSLWRPDGHARLAMLTVGYYPDRWFTGRATISVWPRRNGPRVGSIQLTFTLPRQAPATTVELRARGFARIVTVDPGARTTVHVPFEAEFKWTLQISARRPFLSLGRVVSVQGAPPLLVENRSRQ